MWREVVLVISGDSAEAALETDLVQSRGARRISDRHYHLEAGSNEFEIVFSSLLDEYTSEEQVYVRSHVPDPRYVLIMYMELPALRVFTHWLHDDWLPFFDIEGPGGLELLRVDQALSKLEHRSF